MKNEANVGLSPNRISQAFLLLGFVGILAGAGSAFYSVFSIRPKLTSLTRQANLTVRELAETSELLGGEPQIVSHALKLTEAAGELAGSLPDLTERLRGILTETSRASLSTAKTVKQTKKGIAGVVLPKQELAQTDANLRGAATQMEQMDAALQKLLPASTKLAVASDAFSKSLEKQRGRLVEAHGILPTLQSSLKGTDEALHFAALPLQATLLGLALSGIYFMLGALSLILGFSLRAKQ